MIRTTPTCGRIRKCDSKDPMYAFAQMSTSEDLTERPYENPTPFDVECDRRLKFSHWGSRRLCGVRVPLNTP